MPTGLSSTESLAPPPPRLAVLGRSELRRGLADTRSLLAFRAASLRGRSRRVAAAGISAILLLSLAAAWLPAYLPTGDGRRSDVLTLLPSAMIGILVIAVISAAASAGGRELLPRDQAVAYPVTPLTDHVGALLMAPLNIAWLMQTWALLGATAYVVGPTWRLLLAQLPIVLWLACATALAQVIGWGMEWVRRGPAGLWVIRAVSLTSALLLAWLIASDRLVPLLERSPTLQVTIASLGAPGDVGLRYALVTLTLVVITVAAMAVRRARRRGGGRSTDARRGAPGDRVVPAPVAAHARTSWRWCAPTGSASGARFRCGAASRCSW